VSYTEGDKAYGSEVVERVLTAANLPDTTGQPDLLLLPMDSTAYAQQGMYRFHECLLEYILVDSAYCNSSPTFPRR
jgi:hypothetical protein